MNVSSSASQALERATQTFAAVRAHRLYARRRGLFRKRRWWIVQRNYENLWPYADAWSALCTLGSLPKQEAALNVLDAMRRGLKSYSSQPDILESRGVAGFESVVTPPLGNGGDRYYDDNAWLGLALVRHYELTAEPELLLLARRVFSFVSSGWSDDETWASPGGIRWKEPAPNRSRNTCVNGPASELAARLHEKTGESTYLEWAARIYDWTRKTLSQPEGLYADQITPEGNRNETIWSYNQGTMIGAGVLLHKLTGDSSYLRHSLETASTYLDDRGASELMTQDPAFNAVFFRNLFLLDKEQSSDLYRLKAIAYGSAMWEQKRRRFGLFAGNGSPLNNAAAMIQIYALLAGAEPHA
jgi:hypothetical protein